MGKILEEVEGELSTLLDEVFGIGNLANSVPGVDGVAFRALGPSFSTQSPTPLQSLDIVIPEPSPIALSPISPTTPSPTPTPLQTTSLPPAKSIPTSKPTLESVQEEVVEEKSGGDDEVGGLSAWWRWLLLCLIIVFMLVAIFFVYRGCPGKSQKKHQSFDKEDDEASREN